MLFFLLLLLLLLLVLERNVAVWVNASMEVLDELEVGYVNIVTVRYMDNEMTRREKGSDGGTHRERRQMNKDTNNFFSCVI